MQVTSTHVPHTPTRQPPPLPHAPPHRNTQPKACRPIKSRNAYSHASRPLPSDLSSPKNRLIKSNVSPIHTHAGECSSVCPPPPSSSSLLYSFDIIGGSIRSRCVYRCFPLANSPTVCAASDTKRFRVVSNPSTPTGPLAWMRLVEMPTSAPRPRRKPSANRLEQLWKTSALSTVRKNCCAT